MLFLETKKNKGTRSTRLNELDAKTWFKYSLSVWNDISKTSEEARLNHPAIFPIELPKRLIKIFLTDNKKMVLDPFMGVGTTLVAAAELGKHGIGFEISEKYAQIARERLKLHPSIFDDKDIEYTIFLEDARNINHHLGKETIDLCITSPPYWNILSEKRTADNKPIRDFNEKKNSLSEIYDYDIFLNELKIVFEKVFEVLKNSAFCIINVNDIRKKDKFYPFHIDTAQFMQEIGFQLEDIIIWDRRTSYSNLRLLGYPTVFRVNKIHEYILIFQKKENICKFK